MAHEVETMAYAGDVPWHGLGNPVDDTLTPQEMLVAAGLDWNVVKHPTFIEVDGSKINTGKYALVRDKDNSVLTFTGPGWTPTQNSDAIEFFKHFCETGGAKMETAGALRNGKTVWALAKLGVDYEVTPGDKTEGYLLFNLPHEFGKSINVRTTSVRVVCNNTLTMAMGREAKTEYRQNHMAAFDMDAARETIELARQGFVDQGNWAKKLLKVKVTTKDVMCFLNDLIDNEALTDADYELFEEDKHAMMPKLGLMMNSYHNAPGATEGNAWGILNAVTHYVDHMGKREPSARLNSAWFGPGDKLKQKTVRKLEEAYL